jgi:hypothetical protein
MPGDRNLLSLDASVAIPTRVLCFEDSGLHRCTPVRPVLLTGQTGTHRSDRSDPPVRQVWHCCSTVFGSSVLAFGPTKEPSGFLVNHRKSRELGVASANHHS